MAEVLRLLPPQTHPDLLIGFSTRDDAGVIRVPSMPGKGLVQTMDFFTPVVDDPYAYGQIAAANALSDIYAMGGTPISVMNIACFDPSAAPAEVWAAILQGMADKTAEAGAVVVGGHSVEDDEPKFGMSVTGWVDLDRMFTNSAAEPGQKVWLSKPLGTGIVTTAAKFDKASDEQIAEAIKYMSALNRDAMLAAQAVNARCATDITGFGLVGHLWNIARESRVQIEIDVKSLSLITGVEELIAQRCITGGAAKNRAALGDSLEIDQTVPEWLVQVAIDPQTSGGLAVCSTEAIEGSVKIGTVQQGEQCIRLVN
ncbi:MAG: selenide, water dikinase SelD [Fimbriimonadaceae bacterium]|nr:MAG: selenide, water dikinase SelD [Fimbriimonadaceae bacterium]